MLMEVIGKIGGIVAKMTGDILYADLLIQMLLDIMIGCLDGRIFKRRMLGIGDPLGEV